MITKNAAIEQARRQFQLLFKTMATSCSAWHLYADKDGVRLENASNWTQLPTGLELVVANVHAGTEQQMVNALCIQLDKEWPIPWSQAKPAQPDPASGTRLHGFKWRAGQLADQVLTKGPAAVALQTLSKKRTKGAEAALLASLVVGALLERGQAEKAEAYTVELAKLAEE